ALAEVAQGAAFEELRLRHQERRAQGLRLRRGPGGGGLLALEVAAHAGRDGFGEVDAGVRVRRRGELAQGRCRRQGFLRLAGGGLGRRQAEAVVEVVRKE